MVGLANGSTLSVNAASYGAQGTQGPGGLYYNNITVWDEDSTLLIQGGEKAVDNVGVGPLPRTRVVRAVDDTQVIFTVNDNENATADYYLVNTTTPATALTLAEATVLVDEQLTGGTVTVSDPAAKTGAVTLTVTPQEGAFGGTLTVTDKNGTDITATVLNGKTLTLPDAGLLPLTVYAAFDCCAYPAPLAAGQVTLLLGEEEAGEYTLTGSACRGYTLQNAEGKYLAFENGSLNTAGDTPYVWSYDGGLYAQTKTTQTVKTRTGRQWWLPRAKTVTTVTKSYLACTEGVLTLSEAQVAAARQLTAQNHTYTYLHDGDGCHEAVCTRCGIHEDPAEHDYTFDEQNHKCICGKGDPAWYRITDVKVTAKAVKACRGSWWLGRCRTTATRYQVSIAPVGQQVGVCKVEYTLSETLTDAAVWKTGSCFTAQAQPERFFIRVTDSLGAVTLWCCRQGQVTPVYTVTTEDSAYWTAAEDNPAYAVAGEPLVLNFTTYGKVYSILFAVENATVTSWIQPEQLTTGQLVLGDVTGNVTVSKQEFSCFAAGTKVTMADGSLKNIEEVAVDDTVLCFNHESGEYETQRVYLTYASEQPVLPTTLYFEDGSSVAINMHNFFVQESGNYRLVTRANAQSFVGKHFYSAAQGKYLTLTRVERGTQPVKVYCIYTAYRFNCIAGGLLTLPDDMAAFANFYTFNPDLTADMDALADDILTYGLYPYPQNARYTKQKYDEMQLQYLNIMVGKELISWQELIAMRDEYYGA